MEKEKLVSFPTSVYLTIDSKDRNQISIQPWNRFTLQKPQALLDAFAKKLMVAEVRFPWYIPNVSPLNNVFTLVSTKGAVVDFLSTLTVPAGFYTPDALVIKINQLITAQTYDSPPVLSYDVLSNRYTFTAGSVPFTIYFFDPLAFATAPSEQQYDTTASLMKTLGFNYEQVSGSEVVVAMTGQPTLTLYTNYVDIISTRLTRFQKVRDGDSATNSQASTVCRLYLADEASNPLLNYLSSQTPTVGGNPSGAGLGSFPFIIHRQFKNAKAINWTPDNFVDYFDMAVVDEYNNPVPLLPQPYGSSVSGTFNAQYPDFQITLVCTE